MRRFFYYQRAFRQVPRSSLDCVLMNHFITQLTLITLFLLFFFAVLLEFNRNDNETEKT